MFRQKTFTDEPVPGQAGGAVSVPRLQALEQLSGAGEEQAGVTPVHGGGGGHVTQEIAACQPARVIEKSDVKTKVRQPWSAVTVPGELVPV